MCRLTTEKCAHFSVWFNNAAQKITKILSTRCHSNVDWVEVRLGRTGSNTHNNVYVYGSYYLEPESVTGSLTRVVSP